MEPFPFILLIWKNWWWFLLAIMLYPQVRTLYLWWIRWCVWYKKFKWIVLEIKPPKEILKPFRAMEDIFSVLWGIYDDPNWRERWCEGEIPLGGGLWFSFEIASFGGEIHFFARLPDFYRDTLESAIYSQYPTAEISLVEDYTKNVPQNIPNEKWDLYGEDFSLGTDDVYPIKTYSMFFEERPEVVKEEKRLDPLDSLLEALSKLKPAEQIWLQIVTNPILDKNIPWITRGKKLANKLAKRPPEEKPKSILQETAEILISGKPTEPPKEEVFLIAPELRLTPGEREILKGIETKISKKGYQTWIRTIYLCKRDEPHFWNNYRIARSYFNHFSTENLNYLVFWGPTRTRIHYWFRKRRLYLRKRMQFRRYVQRLPSTWPWSMEGNLPPFFFGPKGPGIRGTFVLNIEELATIYHFPAKVTIPAVSYIEAKKREAPPGLPTE